ncbi:MAG: hypothetical protein JNG88_17545 [Phycisphaerales bacterium]|nr:hypothetical protein [Phycisphaerales bacterium]
MATALACSLLFGCNDAKVNTDETPPEIATYVRMMMPRRIDVQRGLTKPVSFAQNGNPDGLEVVLAAMDSRGAATKVCGTFHFELRERRAASGDEQGPRVAFWPVKIDTEETSDQFFDRLSRFYHFPLELEQAPLKPGRYILAVRLLTPTADTLFGEYEFEQTTQPAPNGRMHF